MLAAEFKTPTAYFSDTDHGWSRFEASNYSQRQWNICAEFYALSEAAFLIPTHYCRAADVEWKLIIH